MWHAGQACKLQRTHTSPTRPLRAGAKAPSVPSVPSVPTPPRGANTSTSDRGLAMHAMKGTARVLPIALCSRASRCSKARERSARCALALLTSAHLQLLVVGLESFIARVSARLECSIGVHQLRKGEWGEPHPRCASVVKLKWHLSPLASALQQLCSCRCPLEALCQLS